MKELTQEILKSLVSYSPITGEFTSIDPSPQSRYRGKRIGSPHRTKKYRSLSLLGKAHKEHRVAFLYMTGKWPTMEVDHINQIKDDNRWCNLRDVSRLINAQNRSKYRNNTSGHTGVSWNKSRNKWHVLCSANGEHVYGGLFDDKEEAAELADGSIPKHRRSPSRAAQAQHHGRSNIRLFTTAT